MSVDITEIGVVGSTTAVADGWCRVLCRGKRSDEVFERVGFVTSALVLGRGFACSCWFV